MKWELKWKLTTCIGIGIRVDATVEAQQAGLPSVAWLELVADDLGEEIGDTVTCLKEVLILLLDRAIGLPGLQLQPDEILQLRLPRMLLL